MFLRRLSEVNYRVKGIQHPREQIVVHFNQLKSCHLTVMAAEGCKVSNIPVFEDTI